MSPGQLPPLGLQLLVTEKPRSSPVEFKPRRARLQGPEVVIVHDGSVTCIVWNRVTTVQPRGGGGQYLWEIGLQ